MKKNTTTKSTAEAVQPRWTRDYVFDALKELGIHYIFGVTGTNEIPIIDGTSYLIQVIKKYF